MYWTPRTLEEARQHPSSHEIEGTGWIVLADRNVAPAVLLVSKYRAVHHVFKHGEPYHDYLRAQILAAAFAQENPEKPEENPEMEPNVAVSTVGATPVVGRQMYLEVAGRVYRIYRGPSIYTNRTGIEDCVISTRCDTHGALADDGYRYICVSRLKAQNGEMLRSFRTLPPSFPMATLKERHFIDE